MSRRSNRIRTIGEEILEKLLRRKEVKRASFAGGLRRGKESVSSIDLLVSSDSPKTLISIFPNIANLNQDFPPEETSISEQSNLYNYVLAEGIPLRLNITSDNHFALLLLQVTGSDYFLEALSRRAEQYGIKISAYGLFLDDHLLPCQEEKELFSILGLDFIPPELREGKSAIESAVHKPHQ